MADSEDTDESPAGVLLTLARSVAADARVLANRVVLRGALATSGVAALLLQRLLPERHPILPDHNTLWRLLKLQSHAVARICGVTITVRGRERLAGAGPFIYVANHQSYFDMIALLAALPGPNRVAITAELAEQAFVGPLCRALGLVVIDEEATPEAILDGLGRISDTEASVVIFPEGRRGPGGRLLRFTDLPFVAAVALGVPVVPVAICGARDVMPTVDTGAVHPGDIEVIVGEPIPTADLLPEDYRPLREDARNAISRHVEEIDLQLGAEDSADALALEGAESGAAVAMAEPA